MNFYGGLMGFYGGLMINGIFYGALMGFNGIYTLVNIQKTMETHNFIAR